MKTLLKIVSVLVLIPALWVGGNLLYGTLTDFTPPPSETVKIIHQQTSLPDSIVTALIWNIGYAGLGEESDFFYDGGKMVRSPKEVVRKNLEGIKEFLKRNDTIDFILLQEVDTLARRSWQFNQYREIAELLKGTHSAAFTLNYNVGFVPVPYLEPMGGVKAGLGSFSRHGVTENTRHQYPSSFAWPTSIYFLDRCLLLQRVPLANGRELVVINTHNSAYDSTGELKAAELGHLKKLLADEHAKGNPVIVGGDWNQTPPNIHPDLFNGSRGETGSNTNLPEEFLSGWHWAYGTINPTNRSLLFPFEKGKTETFLIDLFLLSPGIELLDLQTINMDFKFSDHQPVVVKLKLPKAQIQ